MHRAIILRYLAPRTPRLAVHHSFDLVQHYRPVRVVLQLDGARRRRGDLRVDRRVALAEAVLVDLQLDEGEGIVHRARTPRGLPRADVAIGQQEDGPAALRFVALPRE